MDFIFLSKEAEELLVDITAVNEKSSDEQIDYWKSRFDDLNPNEDERLRNVFNELVDLKFVNIQWGDGIPYYTVLSNKAYNYWDDKHREIKQNKKLSRREWSIAIVSAIVGALVGLIPYFISR